LSRKTRQVALAFPLAPPHLVQVLRGITDYARGRGDWVLSPNPDTYRMSVSDIRGWPGDGVIAMVETPAESRAAQSLGIPVVNLSGRLRRSSVPRVMVDHEGVGRMAAEHLLACGFRRFGYYGPPDGWFAQQRRRGFQRRLQEADAECSVLETTTALGSTRRWHHWQQPLLRWLKTLAPPVGVMATYDARAAMVVEACGVLGLRVPDDVAVIGVDNHEVVCEFCPVPLSSIDRNGYRIGFEAATLLDRLMSGQKPDESEILLPPRCVIKRRSTDVVAVDDPHVAKVVEYIRQHIGEAFGMERLLPLVPTSRRWLEHRFRECLGVTPHEFICRARVERAKDLLLSNQRRSLKEISAACGFTEPRRFRLVFRRLAGMTPAEYRRRHVGSDRGGD